MVLGDRRQNTIPPRDLAAEAASSALERMKRCLDKGVREVTVSPCSSLVRPPVRDCARFWALTGEGRGEGAAGWLLGFWPETSHYSKEGVYDWEFSEGSLRCPGAGTLSQEGKLRARPLFSLHKGRPWELLVTCQSQWGGGQEDESSLGTMEPVRNVIANRQMWK